MRTTALERISVSDTARIAQHFGPGLNSPFILVDAVSDWPAFTKWSLDFFASRFRYELGLASRAFDETSSGKATKLGAFIDHLDKPFRCMPGLLVTGGGRQGRSEDDLGEMTGWAFTWDPFRRHPELYQDISPYPPAVPNIIARLQLDALEAIQKLLSVDLFSIYITRAETVTPLHRDLHHTFGSLVQFEGDKIVFLFNPADYDAVEGSQFDPEIPDFEQFPRMAQATAQSAVLARGEMLIIPPDWWHYTRSCGHSITLSHNFVNNLNLSSFLGSVFDSIGRHPHKHELFNLMSARLECASPYPI